MLALMLPMPCLTTIPLLPLPLRLLPDPPVCPVITTLCPLLRPIECTASAMPSSVSCERIDGDGGMCEQHQLGPNPKQHVV